MAALSDEKLAVYIRRGDRAAFEVLYDRHSAGILAFARHMLRSVEDAEDVVQHTFIAAHADLHRHPERELHVKAWLYTIARNRCLSVLRRRHDQPADDVEIVSDHLNDDVEQRADLRALLADIHKLPGDQREALVLSEVGALSHAEVAEVIGCEVSKVKSLVFQARTALIDRRLARDTSCDEIREQIATLRGGALRRSHLRHHLESCPGCREYREQVRRQRQMLAVALPVVPSAALRGDVLSAIGLGGGTVAAAASAGAGGGLAIAAKSGLAKIGIAAIIAGGAAGGAAVVHNDGLPAFVGGSSSKTDSHGKDSGAPGTSAAGAVMRSAATSTARKNGGAPPAHSKAGSRSASGSEHGFTPVQGGSNGAAARKRAATRGNGRHTGIHKAKHAPTRTQRHRVVKPTPPAHTPPATPHANTTPQTPRATPNTDTTPKTKPAPPKRTTTTTTSELAPATTTTEAAPAPTTDTSTTADSTGGKSGTKRASG